MGGQGQILIEPAGPGIVALKSSVVAPFLGQTIIETSTGRLYWWNGTAWQIYGGNIPMVSLLGGVQPVDTDTLTPLVLGTEVSDTDGFHTSTNGFVTIPSGMGGVYMVTAGAQFAANATGYRATRVSIGNNTGVTPAEPVAVTNGGNQMIGTVNNGTEAVKPYRLRAAATVTANVHHTAGASLSTTYSFLTLHLLRHEPGLS